MSEQAELRVKQAPDGHCPQMFRWGERLYLVRSLESIRTYGSERHYRLGTVDGSFVLSLDVPSGRWSVRHSPGWFSRIQARWRYGARYPLPFWRRRRYRPALTRPPEQVATAAPCLLNVWQANA